MDIDVAVNTPSGKHRAVASAAAASANSHLSMKRDVNESKPIALPPCSNVRECVELLSRLVWNLELRPMQLDVLLQLFSKQNKMKRLLVVQPTGGGKTHIIRMVGTMLSLVWKQEHWIHAIFDRAMSGVYKYHVEAMFLQLISAELLTLQDRDGKLKWTVARDTTSNAIFPPFRYECDTNWDGIVLQDAKKPRRHKIA